MEIRCEGRNVSGWAEQLLLERQTIAALAEKACLGPDRQCDIHLCYGDVPDIVFKGFLVTCRGNLDRIIAYCPVTPSRMFYGSHRMAELRRTFMAVTKIAAAPETARQSPEAIWLGSTGELDRAMPGWVYGLRCMPLAGIWNGEFKNPRPFCPALFEQMARQPQAMRWLARQPTASMKTIIDDPSLPPRVNQVLQCLKSGCSEKEMAHELGISRHTIHVYVKRLYRHFGVHSKGELLSLFMESVPKALNRVGYTMPRIARASAASKKIRPQYETASA